MSNEFETKTEKVRRLVYNGDYKRALQICKEWNYKDPKHGEILRLGYECLQYPEFYKQIGKDPEKYVQSAIRILMLLFLSR